MADIQVKFTGDTSGLQASAGAAQQALSQFGVVVDQARQGLALFAPQTSSAAASGLNLLGSAFEAVTGAIQKLDSTFVNMTAAILTADAIKTTASAYTSYAEACLKAEYATAQFILHLEEAPIVAEANAIKALDLAILGYAGSAVKTAAIDVFGPTITAVRTTIDTYRLLASSAERATLNIISAGGGLDVFVAAANKAGVSVKDFTAGFLAQIQRIPETSDDAAISIEGMLGSIPGYSAEANDALIHVIASMSATGDEAVANARAITSAFNDPSTAGGQTLATMVNKLVDGLQASIDKTYIFRSRLADFKNQIETIDKTAIALGQHLQPDSAIAFYSAIVDRLKAANAEQKALTDNIVASLERQGVIGQAALLLESMRIAREREANVERQKTIDLLSEQLSIQQGIAAVAERQATFETTLDKANPIDSQLEALQAKRDILQGQLDRNNQLAAAQSTDAKAAPPTLSPEDIQTLVRTVIGEASGDHEQQLAVAAVALNRLANGNFGDSLTAILKAGEGTQFNTWKPSANGGAPTDQANSPTPTSAYQYQEILHDIVMPLVNKQVADPTGGALNYYNPSLTKPQNQFPLTGAQLIGSGSTAQVFGTAKNAPAPVAPMDPDDVAKTQQAVEALDAQIKKLNDDKAGGTAIDQASLEIAQRHATATRDELADAQKRVAAAQAEVAASANLAPLAQNQAAQKLADAQAALREKQVDADIAASKVEAATYEQGSQEQVDVLNKALGEKLALYAKDSAAYNGVLQEMIANTKRAVDSQAALAKQGSAVAILARTATQGANPIADAQAKLATAQQGLSQTGQLVDAQGTVVPNPSQIQASTKAQLAAQQAYYEAVDALRNANAAKDRAADALTVAGTQEGSKTRLDAQLAMYQAEIAAAGNDQAKILGIEAQITEAKRAYAKQQAADSVEQENASWDAVERRYAAERSAIAESARLGQITEAQKAAQVLASLDAQLAATKAHYAALAQIEQAGGTSSPMAAIRLEQQAAVAEDKLNAERVASVQAANAQILESYKSSFDQIGSTVSSQLMQMIQGQSRLRDLARAVVLDMIQQFIQARIKIVADWAAGQVAQVAQTVAGESAKTAATATGTAARTNLFGVASMEQSALVAVGVMKSIMASAAETFAGIFGFLSPIMGPAAAGPAAAGQATVAAAAGMASFDVGSWQLPASGMAIVHAGEMIVPAAQTPWAQSLLSAAGGAGGSRTGGGDQHVHFNVTAMDSGDVRRFFVNNSRAILGAIKTGVKNGSHIGLSQVGRP